MSGKKVDSIDINESDDIIRYKPAKGKLKKIKIGDFTKRKKGFILADGKYYPLFTPTKQDQSHGILGSKKADIKKYQELFDNPSKAKYIEITNRLAGVDVKIAGQIFELVNNPKWDAQIGIDPSTKPMAIEKGKSRNIMQMKDYLKIEPKGSARGKSSTTSTTNVRRVNVPSQVVETDDESKVNIDGKNLDVDALKRGEYGYVIDDKIYPMFKMTAPGMISNKDNWEFVESKMLSQEKALFKRMVEEKNPKKREALYYNYYSGSEFNYNIPIDVIDKALEISNSGEVASAIAYLKRNGVNPKEGYNISLYEPDNTFAQNFREFLEGISTGNRGDTSEFEKKKEERKLGEEDLQQRSMNPEEAKELVDNLSGETKGGEGPPQQQQPQIPDPDIEPDGAPLPDAEPGIDIQAEEPPIPEDKQLTGNTVEDVKKGEELRYNNNNQTDNQEEEIEKKDNLPDISKYGHKLAVQNIFKAHNKDFTFFKKLIQNDRKLKPSENKNIRKQRIDVILAEYDSLFPVLGLKSDYDIEECLEIITFKYCYKENIRFDKSWKRAIRKLNNNGNMNGNQDLSKMSQGLIVNMAGLGLNVGQVINQQGQGQPQQSQVGNNNNNNSTGNNNNIPKKGDKMKKIRGGVVSEEYNGIAKPLSVRPQSNRKERKTRRLKKSLVEIKIRKKVIKPRLFSNLNHQPEQQNLRPSGQLPTLRLRKNKKLRFKF